MCSPLPSQQAFLCIGSLKGSGHSFILFLGDGFFPLNVLNTLKMVPEVCRLFCATANPTEVVLAESD